MKIKVEKREHVFAADMLERSGSPPVVYGMTKEAAIAGLFVFMLRRERAELLRIADQSPELEIIDAC